MRRFLVTVLLVSAAPVFAEDREGAGIHFQAAQAAEKRGDWQTAIDEYGKAYDLAPHPAVLFNIANAYEKLGDPRGAGKYLERYLRDNPQADDRAEVERRIASLRDRPSTLIVLSPPGAMVIVDGEPVGQVPLTREVPAGQHRVRIELDGKRSDEVTIGGEYGERLTPQLSIDDPAIQPNASSSLPYARGAIGLGFGVGYHNSLGGEWEAGLPISLTGRLRGALAVRRKLRLYVELGGSIGPSIEDSRVGNSLGPKERFITFEPRGGIAYALLQRGGVRVDAVGFGTLIGGYHSMSFGLDEAARQGISGAGVGGGIELTGVSERSPRNQWYVAATYAVVPTAVGDGTGFRSTGTVDLGGFEFVLGWSVLIGMPTQRTPSMIAPAGNWSAQR